MASRRPLNKRRPMDGDALPDALAALARTRERTLAEIAESESTDSPSADATSADSTSDDPISEAGKKAAQESEDRVAFR